MMATSSVDHLSIYQIVTFVPHARPWGCSWTGSQGWRSAPTLCTRWGLSIACWCFGDWGPAGCCWGETHWSQIGQQLHWQQPKAWRRSVIRTELLIHLKDFKHNKTIRGTTPTSKGCILKEISSSLPSEICLTESVTVNDGSITYTFAFHEISRAEYSNVGGWQYSDFAIAAVYMEVAAEQSNEYIEISARLQTANKWSHSSTKIWVHLNPLTRDQPGNLPGFFYIMWNVGVNLPGQVANVR